MYKRLFASAIIFGLLATAPPVLAQNPVRCAPREVIIATLKQKHGETARAVGLTGTQAAFEIWASRTGGSWTLLVTRPNKTSCVVAAGDTWVELPPDTSALGRPTSYSLAP